MKKKLILCMATGLCVLLSCQKDNVKTNNANSPGVTNVSFTSKTRVDQSFMLSQDPSDPTGNTWDGEYNGYYMEFTGLTYDHLAYPNNVDGVPAIANVGILTGAGTITQANVKNGATYITIVAPKMVFHAADADIMKFEDAYSAWISKGAAPASAVWFTDYIKPSYWSGTDTVTTTTCKLIRVSGGTHWALAATGYPQPTPVIVNPTPPPGPDAFSFDFPGSPAIWFTVTGSNGIINAVPAANYEVSPYQSIPIASVTGTYNSVNNTTQQANVNVTIYPAIGSPITYSGPATLGY